MKTFTLYFPEVKDFLLTKDLGIIPFIIKNYYGYKSRIICDSIKGKLISNKKYLNNLEIIEIKNAENFNDLLLNSDILMLHGAYDYNLKIINKYKKINPKGKVYLKLDGNIYWMSNLNKVMTQEIRETLLKCNLITVESRRLTQLLNSLWGLDIKFLPNGYYEFIEDKKIEYKDKENIILFAGRVGSKEKYNELLLEAFKNISKELKNWKLEFVGEVDDNFLLYLNEYIKNNNFLKNKVKLWGKKDKSELKKIFIRAKIFCLTSFSESCANVFAEAIYNGCYLISSDVDGAIDIIDYGRVGSIFPIGDLKALEISLLEIIKNEELLAYNCENSQFYARENLSWIKLSKDILEMLNEQN